MAGTLRDIVVPLLRKDIVRNSELVELLEAQLAIKDPIDASQHSAPNGLPYPSRNLVEHDSQHRIARVPARRVGLTDGRRESVYNLRRKFVVLVCTWNGTQV